MIKNPILRGFCPDPSVIRVGEDYYIVNSTFEWWPGVRLWHSRDLEHWEQLPSPLNRLSQLNMLGDPTSGGIWAPDISYDGKRFYLVYTDVKTKKGRYYNNHNYLVWADDICGPWSDPVYLNSTGFDPSMLHDTDGKKYLVNMRNGFKGVLVQEYDPCLGRLTGEVRNVFSGTELGFTEGPHIYHIGDFYYCLAAEGGTGYQHCVTMARSRSLWGPYEVDPGNPVMLSDRRSPELLQKCGHGDLVETPYGEWYLVHLCARPSGGRWQCVLGRETGIQKVYWNDEGWLRLSCGRRFAQNETERPHDGRILSNKMERLSIVSEETEMGITESRQLSEESVCKHENIQIAEKDDFDSPGLGVRYSMPRVPLGDCLSLTQRPGWLRLYGQESLNSLHHVSLVAVRQTEYRAQAETCVECVPTCPEQIAGLSYMYDAANFYLFGKTADDEGRQYLTIVKSDRLEITDVADPIWLTDAERIWLRIEAEDRAARCLYSLDGQSWEDCGVSLDTDILTDEHCRGFTGAHFGMYCHDMTGQKIKADFDYFLC